MFNIYQRFSNNPPTATPPPPDSPQRQPSQGRQLSQPQPANVPQRPTPHPGHQAHTPPPKQVNHRQHQAHTQNPQGHSHHKPKSARGFEGILTKLLPASVYNPDTKKIFGLLTAEDLLLVALIFLLLDSNDEDSTLTVLALAFVLLSDYIDLSALNL